MMEMSKVMSPYDFSQKFAMAQKKYRFEVNWIMSKACVRKEEVSKVVVGSVDVTERIA